MQKVTKMTVLPIRIESMTSSPTNNIDMNKETKTSRISNFSVASLLADTRSKTKTPPQTVIKAHSDNFHSNFDISLTTPKNLSISNIANSCSPNSQNNDSNNSNTRIHSDSELLVQRSHSPHSSIVSEEYDESAHGDMDDDDEDSIVDIEDVKNENSTNSLERSKTEFLQTPPHIADQPLIRPTPFSALAAAAAAWGSGVPGWPARQMPPFGAPGLFAQRFPNHGGKDPYFC
jgi:hypothetical protein